VTFFTLCARVDFHVEDGSPGVYSGTSNMTGIAMNLSFRSSALVRANGSGFWDLDFGIWGLWLDRGMLRGVADVPPTEEDVASSGYDEVGGGDDCDDNRESISSNASAFDGCIFSAARRSEQNLRHAFKGPGVIITSYCFFDTSHHPQSLGPSIIPFDASMLTERL